MAALLPAAPAGGNNALFHFLDYKSTASSLNKHGQDLKTIFNLTDVTNLAM